MTSTVTESPPALSPPAFEEEARRILNRVRRAFASLLDSVSSALPGVEQPTPTHLQRVLGIPSTLAWRIHRVACASNPLREVESIPGPSATQRVVDRGRRKGLPRDRLSEALEAVEELERLVQQHAGSRRTFNSMMASLAGEAEEVADLACRKAAYQVNSQIWGVQARALIWTAMYTPGSQPRTMNNAILMGAADVKRLHADASPHELRLQIGDASAAMQFGDDEAFGPVLLEEFSTQPLPVISRTRSEKGGEQVLVQPPAMGSRGAISFFIAEGGREIAWQGKDETEPLAVPQVHCSTPAEVLIVDVLVYDDMFGRIEPEAGVFDYRSPTQVPQEVLKRRRLPINVQVEHLGSGLDAAHLSDLPRYSAMVEHVCNRLSWDPSRFSVYRCRVAYPVMSSSLAVWFPLPEDDG